jgi:CheY-like chemotaxis protein
MDAPEGNTNLHMKKLKILVFDDSEIHRTAAKLSLEGHDLTIVGTYDEAQEALVPKRDSTKAERLLVGLLEEAGLPADFKPWAPEGQPGPSAADIRKYEAVCDKADELGTTYPKFDVVLTDLLVPASSQAQGDEGQRLVGQEMPLGTTIALLALTVGIKNVAVVTDMNHHKHPASAAFDHFQCNRCPEGVRILCTNSVDRLNIDVATKKPVDLEFLESKAGLKKYPFKKGEEGWGQRKGLTRGGKDWREILRQLVGDDAG